MRHVLVVEDTSDIAAPLASLLAARGFDPAVVAHDVVAGLDAGADDYLAKPCSVAELQARVHSVLRRTTRTCGPPDDMVDGSALEMRDRLTRMP